MVCTWWGRWVLRFWVSLCDRQLQLTETLRYTTYCTFSDLTDPLPYPATRSRVLAACNTNERLFFFFSQCRLWAAMSSPPPPPPTRHSPPSSLPLRPPGPFDMLVVGLRGYVTLSRPYTWCGFGSYTFIATMSFHS